MQKFPKMMLDRLMLLRDFALHEHFRAYNESLRPL